MRASKRLGLSVTAAAALMLLATLAAPAMGADKPFAVVVSNGDGTTPSSLPAGAEGTVRVTYTNLNTQQSLGSSNLVVPSALRIVSASVSRGAATVAGDSVRLRNLNLAPAPRPR